MHISVVSAQVYTRTWQNQVRDKFIPHEDVTPVTRLYAVVTRKVTVTGRTERRSYCGPTRISKACPKGDSPANPHCAVVYLPQPLLCNGVGLGLSYSTHSSKYLHSY